MPDYKMDIPGFTITATPTTPMPAPVPAPTGQRRPDVAKGTGLFVVGPKVFDAAGAPFVMRGCNTTMAWGHTEKNLAALKEIAETGANTVRLVFDVAFPYYASRLDAVLAECARLKLVAVVGAWMSTGKDDVASLAACVDFWLEPSRAAALKKWERSVILNPANEWGGSGAVGFDGARWRTNYALQLERIRAAGINALVMIDAGGAYSNNPRSVRDYGGSLLLADPNDNVVFSLHTYTYWRTIEGAAGVGKWNDHGSQSPWLFDTELKAIVDKGLAVVVGEIGAGGPQVPFVTATALAVLEALGVGWLAWSWNQNSDGTLDVIPAGGVLYDGVASVQPQARVFLDPKVGWPAARPAAM